MKLCNFRAGALVVCAFLWCSAPCLYSESSLQDRVNAFSERLKAAQPKQTESVYASEKAPDLSLQYKLIEMAVARGDYHKAQQALQTLQYRAVPPDLQPEWLELVAQITQRIEDEKLASTEKWRAEVDQLVKDAREACLSAKKSEDLDTVLIRCAALQLMRSSSSDVLTEVVNRKLQGTAETLKSWTSFLDLRNAGKDKAANDLLRNMLSNETQFPVLSVAEIRANVIETAAPVTTRTAIASIFEGVDNPDQLSIASERLKTLLANPLISQELQSLRAENDRIDRLSQAWEAAKKERDDQAVTTLKSVQSGSTESQPFYDKIKQAIVRRLAADKVKTWSNLKQEPDEDIRSFMVRVFDELQGKEEYSSLSAAISFYAKLEPMPDGKSTFGTDRDCIEKYLAAQRLEEAGDTAGAVAQYRFVVGSIGGKYAPLKKAQDRLRNLKEKHPEAFMFQPPAIDDLRTRQQNVPMNNRPPSPRTTPSK